MLNKLDPFNVTPAEIGRIAAAWPGGLRAEYIVTMIAEKPYHSSLMFQEAADRAMLEMVKCEAEKSRATRIVREMDKVLGRKGCGCGPGKACNDCF